ncbi:hypothetical protein PRO82_001752 [Candidatus Protochlamydia amoebophila]|nr:hypothetical protein [Candidatus Protochlamydia amoebophila]
MNPNQKFMKLTGKIFRKRAIIAKVNDPLKNISQIEHTRHRNAGNFLINRFGWNCPLILTNLKFKLLRLLLVVS